jgi:hypothetical protein
LLRRSKPSLARTFGDATVRMANHASTRTIQLYDRRRDETSLDNVEVG